MSKGKKQKQEDYWGGQMQTAYQNAQAPNPLEQRLSARTQQFLDWDADPNKNITDSRSGVNDYIQIGQGALARAGRERMGSGALRLSDGGASGYAEKLRTQKQAEMGNEFGAGLENALAASRAQATNSVLPLASLDMSRRFGLADRAAGNFHTYLNRPKANGFWSQFFIQGLKSAGDVATAMAAGG